MGRFDALDGENVVKYVLSCQNKDGGFGGHTGHDSHLLYTMSAVQILALYDRLGDINKEANPETGYMQGDEYGETDTRFAFIGLAICNILGNIEQISHESIVEFVEQSMNYDGGFGSGPGGESHAAQVYTSLAALAIAGRLDIVNREKLAGWLSERQQTMVGPLAGGLNGRPQKLPDSCYSWWVVSSLSILGRIEWIDANAVEKFVLKCQDTEAGGIADRPGDYPDVYHTCFGIAGLSLLGRKVNGTPLLSLDPVYCLPVHVVDRLGLSKGPNGWRTLYPKSWV
ncbi:hypothetical protein BB560_004914 [Smittium megazygosporum]|uniref:Geranylgeranyl transferase type-2 subunit beta n=1 Tax=Smittium megazygosporum TaxID=133381 RepID=A0A2T9Z7X9_9FUNG|nr:hypothetical protein BB560_004914 [Smittium megazygosporum]